MHTLTVDEQKTAQVPDAFMNRPIVSQGIGSEITAYARCIRSSPIYTSTSWKTLIALTLDANLLHQQRFSRHVTNHRILFLICVNIDRTFEKSNSKCIFIILEKRICIHVRNTYGGLILSKGIEKCWDSFIISTLPFVKVTFPQRRQFSINVTLQLNYLHDTLGNDDPRLT